MKTQIVALFCLALPVSFPAVSAAARAEITWGDPSLYTDIWPSQQVTRATTLKNVKHAFTGAFSESAAALPDGYAFKAAITDVDLAGQVSPPQLLMADPKLVNRPQLISTRALTVNYFPAIRLDYTLTDPQGNILLSQEGVVVNDPSYLTRVNAGSTSTPFFYETRMIRDWFGAAIVPAAVQ